MRYSILKFVILTSVLCSFKRENINNDKLNLIQSQKYENIEIKEKESGTEIENITHQHPQIKLAEKAWVEGKPEINIRSIDNDIRAAIIPHAGLKHCGEIIKLVFDEIDWIEGFDEIMMLSTSDKPTSNYCLPAYICSLPIPNSSNHIETHSLKDNAKTKGRLSEIEIYKCTEIQE